MTFKDAFEPVARQFNLSTNSVARLFIYKLRPIQNALILADEKIALQTLAFECLYHANSIDKRKLSQYVQACEIGRLLAV